ncbi:hypothetical protein LTR08_006546 [Meristemomyces frigidus]|nr:hypothetical protein LTR08_006546 [Meristemomyces frigidus]
MKSFTATAFAASATLLLSAVSAQEQYTIDPNSVSNTTRENWCTNELSQCPLICLQTAAASSETESNSCDADALTYSCVCSDGNSPNLTEFSQTIPYFICTAWGTQCVANCGSNNTCSSNCRSEHPCGAQSPVLLNTSTQTKTMSQTSSGSNTQLAGATTTGGETVYSGLVGGQATSTGSSDGGSASASAGGAATLRVAALNAGQTFGLLGFVGAMVGVFAVLL